ncbi:MAG: ATP-dependent DNA ligase, partial [Pseudomonadota bacterium]
MSPFSDLLDHLVLTPSRNAKIALMTGFFRDTPDPSRGWALATLVGTLDFPNVKPRSVRELVTARMDPVLFEMSYDYVGDLAETVGLVWPTRPGANRPPPLEEVVDALQNATRSECEALIERWLDALDAKGRWALLKLITGGLRIGVSARLAKTALAEMGVVGVNEIEEI